MSNNYICEYENIPIDAILHSIRDVIKYMRDFNIINDSDKYITTSTYETFSSSQIPSISQNTSQSTTSQTISSTTYFNNKDTRKKIGVKKSKKIPYNVIVRI